MVIKRAFELLLDPAALIAFLTWPQFSLTSHRMVSDLCAQGVRPRTVIDVGANVGQFAVAASRLFRPVAMHCFEPAADCVTRLQRNVAKVAGVTIYPVALSDCPGETILHINSHCHSSSLLSLAEGHKEAFPDEQVVATVAINASTLDKELSCADLASPVLVKMDVQGAEAGVIRGAAETLKRTDYVIIETSFKPMYHGELLFQDIHDLMKCQGFEFSRPLAWLAHPVTNEVLQMDAFFTRKCR